MVRCSQLIRGDENTNKDYMHLLGDRMKAAWRIVQNKFKTFKQPVKS